jgi:hypothetical protein
MGGKLRAFIDGLIVYDYILFATSFCIFILLVILGILLRKKTFISVTLILIAFLNIILVPTVGYVKMHEYLYKNELTLTYQKKLTFTKALVVEGTIKNLSKKDFKKCKIKIKVLKVTGNALKDYLFQFKPLKKMSIVQTDIKKSQLREFKAIVEPFSYAKDYNISLEASCR